jgi:antitoxin (DNA-binding transcriptional repressor) of toxin-antitoxin stability system
MYKMKGFSVAEARARFGDLLDQAEQGEAVVIERRGITFTLRADVSAQSPKAAPFFSWVDPAVEDGEWTWQLGRTGAKFRARRRKTR